MTTKHFLKNQLLRVLMLSFSLMPFCLRAQEKNISVEAYHFSAGQNMDAKADSSGTLHFLIHDRDFTAFTQSAVKQDAAPAAYGPSPDRPYFHVSFALPIPPAYAAKEAAALTGIDVGNYHHNHSPGFEILPNGDALAVYFSTPRGKAESDTATTFVQARLRYGSLDWDMPELFFRTERCNDQSGLLWNDNGRIWFFGGGRSISDYVPFRIATSDDNGATWTYRVPMLGKAATDFTAQPITNAFRGADGAIYMAMDADGSQSFLWRSRDEGLHWEDMGGRTGARHSTIVPLDDKGTLLSIGGKNANVGGWTPMNLSHDYGHTWTESTSAPFPQLGSGQRPSMTRLKDGALVFVSDGYLHKYHKAPPQEWQHPYNAFVAISKDGGKTWRIKTLPVGLPQDGRPPFTSLGYATVRQAPNGVIHVLGTKTYPGLHYEFNEAWIYSDAGDIRAETTGGTVKQFEERYPSGNVRCRWRARICPDGRYLLHGRETDYWENGRKQHEVEYLNGRKTGRERFWDAGGTLLWSWERDLKTEHGVWTHYWKNGQKKIESNWDLHPEARDAARRFYGYVAEGPAYHYDEQGKLTGTYRFERGELKE